jgi:hypothetical protein
MSEKSSSAHIRNDVSDRGMCECIFCCGFQIGRGDPCITSAGTASEATAAFEAGHLPAIHALKSSPLRRCFPQEIYQTLVIRQLHDMPAAAGTYLPVLAFDGCFLMCHDIGSFSGSVEHKKRNRRAFNQ